MLVCRADIRVLAALPDFLRLRMRVILGRSLNEDDTILSQELSLISLWYSSLVKKTCTVKHRRTRIQIFRLVVLEFLVLVACAKNHRAAGSLERSRGGRVTTGFGIIIWT